jgi:predicted dehydrogenase
MSFKPSSRRHFIISAGAALTAAQATHAIGANDRIRVGIVGLGGRGKDHMDLYFDVPGAEVVALCDIEQAALERAAAYVVGHGRPKAKEYADMRGVFDDPGVDAVSMPLPNHWHALATIWACQAGKDVYIEKPASHNVFEGLRMTDAARKYRRMVQVGSHSRSMPHKRKAIGLLHEGIIGNVYLAKAICFKRRLSLGHAPDGPVPPGVDWDKFRGPAPMRAFNPLRFKYNWHWFWDTGNGDIGNMGPHEIDMARWGLGKELPTAVISTGGKYVVDDDRETPNMQVADFDYRDSRVVFEARGLLTGTEGDLPKDKNGDMIGNLFYGSEGWMSLEGFGFRVYKGEKREKVMDEKGDDSTMPHIMNFLEAVRSRDYNHLHADIATGAAVAAMAHIANISYRLGRKLTFDPRMMQFPGDAEANQMLTRVYRAPYIVPHKV